MLGKVMDNWQNGRQVDTVLRLPYFLLTASVRLIMHALEGYTLRSINSNGEIGNK